MTTHALERKLDNNYDRATRDYNSATQAASDDPGAENMQAIFEESLRMTSANFALGQAMKAKHAITKSVLDGFQ
jgi:hypothetical protein